LTSQDSIPSARCDFTPSVIAFEQAEQVMPEIESSVRTSASNPGDNGGCNIFSVTTDFPDRTDLLNETLGIIDFFSFLARSSA
jgi:hypothetical protein